MRVQSAVFTETRRITYGTAVCFALTNLVALIIGEWNYTILLGALLGGACAVLCFFLMALAVQSLTALTGDEAEKLRIGKRKMRSSYVLRLVIMALVFVLAAKTPPFNWVATAVMLLAPRLVIMGAQAYISLRKRAGKAGDGDEYMPLEDGQTNNAQIASAQSEGDEREDKTEEVN